MTIPLTRLWIWLCAFATCAGWTLSAIDQLNRGGYAIAFAVVVIVFFVGRAVLLRSPNIHGDAATSPYRNWKKCFRRFRRPLPLAFFALAILIFLGGAIYPPSNYTGLQYHLARVLQWLAHDGWWWIHSPNYRMNDRATGTEWLLAPLLLFTKSDRLLFLVNFIPFLLMPGLIFSIFTRLGISVRVAWQWMWLLPTGYNFILQAGSIANDTFPTVFALAAIDFALRACQSGKFFDVGNSILAAALLTGAKASNLPLLLPWAIAFFPSLPVLRKKILPAIPILLLAATVSFLPNAILNSHFCGDWSGANLEEPRLAQKNPIAGIYGNFFQIALDNFAPPIFPLAHWWNDRAAHFMPHFLVANANKYFDDGFFALGELPTEDWAGIGFGLSILLLVSIVAALYARRNRRARTAATAMRWPFFISIWLALIAYSAKSGLTNTARIIAPYYPLLIASLVVSVAWSEIIRRRWWKIFAGIAVALSFVVLIVSADRPLWPAKTILSKLVAQHPNSSAISRALNVYTIYSKRSDPLASVRQLLPENIKVVGFIGGADDMDISLWRPFGSRTVKHFFWNDSEIRSQVQYAVVGGANLKARGATIDDWLLKNNAELIAATNATLKVGEGVQPWFVVQLK